MNEFEELGFAKLDLSREERTGSGEVLYCAGKTREQLRDILLAFNKKNVPVLGTRCTPAQIEFLQKESVPVKVDTISRTLTLGSVPAAESLGKIAVCTGGTSDIAVAEEAAKTAEFFGAEVSRFYDVGIAGLHRLLAKIDEIREADVVIAIAGMEGALAGVIAGLVRAPVVAVPTSCGYGAAFGGIAPLLTMLNSCAEGVAVVNIDNGFGAGTLACRILRGQKRTENK